MKKLLELNSEIDVTYLCGDCLTADRQDGNSLCKVCNSDKWIEWKDFSHLGLDSWIGRICKQHKISREELKSYFMSHCKRAEILARTVVLSMDSQELTDFALDKMYEEYENYSRDELIEEWNHHSKLTRPRHIMDIENDKVTLSVIECICGFHIGLDATFVNQVEHMRMNCPSCFAWIDTEKIL